MQSKTLTLLTLSTLTFTLISCKDDSPAEKALSAGKEVVTGIKLQDRWTSSCQKSNLIGVQQKHSYAFKGTKFTEQYELYSNNDCQNPEGVVSLKGDYSLDKNDKSYNVDFNYKEMTIKVNSEVMVKVLSAVNFCGVDKWKINTEFTISNTLGKDCFISNIPTSRYGMLEVDSSKDELYLSGDFSNKSEERSPIDFKYAYKDND